MAIELINGAHFLHIPKTGGSFVRRYLEANNLVAGARGRWHNDYDRNLHYDWYAFSGKAHLKKAVERTSTRLADLVKGQPTIAEDKTVFRFCFVRHPLTWYESYWRYMRGRWEQEWGEQNSALKWHVVSTLNGLGDDDFNTFVRNVLQARPGWVSELYFSFTKPGISFIGRMETLREDLQYVLDQQGLPYDAELLFNFPQKNVTRSEPVKIEWDPDLKRTITVVELPALIHFGYLPPEEFAEFGLADYIPPHPAMRRKDHDFVQTPVAQTTG